MNAERREKAITDITDNFHFSVRVKKVINCLGDINRFYLAIVWDQITFWVAWFLNIGF